MLSFMLTGPTKVLILGGRHFKPSALRPAAISYLSPSMNVYINEKDNVLHYGDFTCLHVSNITLNHQQ